MADSFEEDSDSFEPEGGAEGGGGSDKAPSKALIRPVSVAPEVPETETDKAIRERYERLSRSVDMSRGGALGTMSPDDKEFYENKRNEKGLGRLIAFASGVPYSGASVDELSALFQTGETSGPAYDARRNEARNAIKQATNESPLLPVAGSLMLGPGSAATMPARMALSTAAGVAEGVGAAPTMKDVPGMALGGGAMGAGAGLLGEAMRAGGSSMGAKRDAVVSKVRGNTDKAIDSGFASTRGAYGAEVASGNRILENLADALENPNADPALRRAAEEFLNGPEGQKLYNQVLQSNLGRGTDALARIERTRDAMTDYAAQKMTPEARAAAAQARLNDSSALTRRLRELGPKVVLPAVGGALGGPLGAGAGGVAGAALGRSGTTVKNLFADPYVSSRVFGAGDALLTGAGKTAAQSGPAIEHEALDRWARLLNDEEQPK